MSTKNQNGRTETIQARRILIVDTNEPVLFAFTDYFDLLGYKVDAAHNLREFYDRISSVQYDVVIADAGLNGSEDHDGLEIQKCVIRHSPSTATILLAEYPIKNFENDRRHKLLLKPQSLPQLARVINDLIAN